MTMLGRFFENYFDTIASGYDISLTLNPLVDAPRAEARRAVGS
jgi:hypothetical protein